MLDRDWSGQAEHRRYQFIDGGKGKAQEAHGYGTCQPSLSVQHKSGGFTPLLAQWQTYKYIVPNSLLTSIEGCPGSHLPRVTIAAMTSPQRAQRAQPSKQPLTFAPQSRKTKLNQKCRPPRSKPRLPPTPPLLLQTLCSQRPRARARASHHTTPPRRRRTTRPSPRRSAAPRRAASRSPTLPQTQTHTQTARAASAAASAQGPAAGAPS